MHCRICAVLLVGTLVSGCGLKVESPTVRSQSSEGSTDETASPNKLGDLRIVQGSGELGDADYLERKSCTFVVANDTPRPLSLFVADKSCACAGVELKPSVVPSKEATAVTLQWTPKLDQNASEDVRVHATVRAKEDPQINLHLVARGRIRPALLVNLPRGELDFGRMDVADLQQGRVLALEVYTTDQRRKGFTLQATSSHPGLKLMPSEPERLTNDRLNALRAVAGYRINIHAGPELPIGRFREFIKLQSDAYPDRNLEIAVIGQVESGAVSVTPEAVALPETLALATGYKSPPMEVTLRGEPDRTLTFVSADPPFLQVRVEAVRSNVWRIHVTVPAGEGELLKHVARDKLDEMVAYGFNDGCLLFKTNHSRVPTLQVPIPGRRLQR